MATLRAPIGIKSALDRLIAALTDPARRERTAIAVLAVYCSLWALYGAIAKGSQDVHFDMGEMVAWSREATWGTPKHPPLGAWLVRAWFSVFPLADWSYYLFAMMVATVALWLAWRISRHYLGPEKRVVGLALLTLVPFFNFHALKYNANTVMLPLWAAATAAFLRSYETRNVLIAALAGVTAAAAMLGKYWSAVLLLGLGLAALIDQRRAAYFRSSAPWITIAAGSLALAPHVAWLHAHDFTPFAYAMDTHPGTLLECLWSGVNYVIGAAAYVAVPVMLALLAAWPSPAALRDMIWPEAPDRKLVVLAFVLPLALPTLFAVAAHEVVTSLWAIASMTLLPAVLLSSPRSVVPQVAARRIVGFAVAFPLIALALSPVIALVIHRGGVPNYATHYRGVARAVESAWAQTTDRPLRFIGSYNNLLYGALFYLPREAAPLEIVNPAVTPWIDEAQVARDGIALVCPTVETTCMHALEARAAQGAVGRRIEVEITRRYFGTDDKPDRFLIVTIKPRE
ncbi:MAG TPA: glycosyltransferase family 39 protein [Xanthobacteraceae bacterium]|nr:glycosyltransferase family 39 protein [Xanthobacteraceae bacterium]